VKIYKVSIIKVISLLYARTKCICGVYPSFGQEHSSR